MFSDRGNVVLDVNLLHVDVEHTKQNALYLVIVLPMLTAV